MKALLTNLDEDERGLIRETERDRLAAPAAIAWHGRANDSSATWKPAV